jgi:hypothetical protein
VIAIFAGIPVITITLKGLRDLGRKHEEPKK